MRGRAALLSAGVLALAGGVAAAGGSAAPAAGSRELLVRFEPGARQAEVVEAIGGRIVERSSLRGFVRVRLDAGTQLAAAGAALERRDDVAWAGENRTFGLHVEPDDFSALWGLTKIAAPTAWDKQTGSDALTVAVVDTGVEYTHSDLAPNAWRNPGEDGKTAGVDDDGNGYVDDVYGWDFWANDAVPLDEADSSHGTHVAGTIGARGNNGLGLVGVNWRVKVMALRVGSDDGLSEFAIQNAFLYACANGAKVVNGSFGGQGFSPPIHAAIVAPVCQNTLFVVSAGNGGYDGIGDDNDLISQYPCNETAPNVVCVAATDTADSRTSFSNFGANNVDLAAPGELIESTIRGDTYGYLSGTSMASPHVAGAAALVLADRPALSVAELRSALLLSVDPVPGLQVFSGGRLNVAKALGQEVVPPVGLSGSAPTHPTGGWSNQTTVTFSWGGATDANAIDGYSYAFSPLPDFVPDERKDVEETTTSVTTLLPDGDHWFHVRARDGAGNWGAAVHIGPIRIDTFAPVKPVPSSPSHRVGGASSDRTIAVAWSGGSDSASGLDGYSFSWSRGRAMSPDLTKNAEETVSRTTSPPLAVGAWWFNIRSRDNAGNWSETVSVGPFSLRSGPAACAVPRLRGLSLKAAKTSLAKRGCALGRVTRVRSKRVRRGHVVAQRPAPGLRLGRGTRVAVVLSRGRR